MDSALYNSRTKRARVSVYARRNPHAGPAMTRADLFRPAPGAPVLGPRERAELLARMEQWRRAPGMAGLGWGFHFNLPHISLPSLPHISIPSPAALAHKLGLPSPADIAHKFHLPTPADILQRMHIKTGLPAAMVPGTQALRDQAAYQSALAQARAAAAQQTAIQQAAAQAAANQAAADQFIVQQAQQAGAAAPATALPSVSSLFSYAPPASPTPDYSQYASDLSTVNLPSASSQYQPASADQYGASQYGDQYGSAQYADMSYQPSSADQYQNVPSPATTVPATSPDVSVSAAYTVPDTGSTIPDFSSGYGSSDFSVPADSSGYDYASGGYGLSGMGADPAAAPTTSSGWSGALENLLNAGVGVWQQKKLIDINLQRAQQGLPPLSATDAGVGVQASVGLDRPTRNMIIMGIAGLTAVGAAFYYANKKR